VECRKYLKPIKTEMQLKLCTPQYILKAAFFPSITFLENNSSLCSIFLNKGTIPVLEVEVLVHMTTVK